MENGYRAGDLNLSIRTSADDTLKYLDSVIERLAFIDKHLGDIKGNSYIRKSVSRTPKSNGGLFGLAKIGFTLHSVRRLGRFMGDLVQAGSDYNETLNLWQVAMRNNLDVADQFISKMQKAYGISSKTLMEAQAVFKNMIGSLGQISDATAYALSEALVQMSADYASLYNRTLDSAFKNMQAMLASQVRPIRSAGLDMTETTLFQFYQQLGGTKTMRQLNRTEKQLLSILAVYRQMGSAGALGDMSKTLNQFANQSRMMTEYWRELKTWSGLLLKDLIDQSGALIYINALLITATEIIKAIAKSRGLGEDNFIEGMFEATEATNDEIDELQGKLLDFDKFRSLEGASASPLAIDEKLIEAITGYSSKIDEAKNEANILAQEWGKILGFTIDANGQWVISEENLKNIETNIKNILGVFSALSALVFAQKSFKNTWLSVFVAFVSYGYVTNEEFRTSINKLAKSLIPILNTVVKILPSIVKAITPIVETFAKIILQIDEMGLLEPLIYAIITGFASFKALKMMEYVDKLAGKFKLLLQSNIALPNQINKTLPPLEKQKLSFKNVAIAMAAMAGSYLLVSNYLNNFEGEAKKTASICAIIVGGIMAITAAWVAMKGAMSWGTALPVLLAGVGTAIAGVQALTPKIEVAAVGASNLDSGTLFVAGEMGRTEAVYTGSNGKTNVANVKQMEQAFYNAISRHSREGNDKIVVQAYLDGEKIYENTTSRAKSRGNTWAKV